MESNLDRLLQHASRTQLLRLLRELVVRHPLLSPEIIRLLDEPNEDSADGNDSPTFVQTEGDVDINATSSEDWDFNGDEVIAFPSLPPPILLPLDQETYRLRLESYVERLNHGVSAQAIFDDLTELLEEAETRAEQHDYLAALQLYALIIDERILERSSILTGIFDKAIDEIMPIIETLLSEASSNNDFNTGTPLFPALSTDVRHRWLERLFMLWLRYLDARHQDEDIAELLLTIAWNEDIPLLSHLVQQELQQQPTTAHLNIVDFSHQYRVRTLEKFLKELPWVE